MYLRDNNPQKRPAFQKPRKTAMDILFKKRINQENEVVIQKTVGRAPMVTYGDRFIPRRYVSQQLHNAKFFDQKDFRDIFQMRLHVNYWRQNGFTTMINEAFDIRDRRMFQFSDAVPVAWQSRDTDWACHARAKPLAFPEATHDLPGFDMFIDHNLVDWSVNDQIVASFGHDVIVWKRGEDQTMVFNVHFTRAVSYAPNGNYLAIACKVNDYPVLELWDVSCLDQFMIANGRVFNLKHGCIRCIAWHKLGTELVCGTQSGALFVLSVPQLKIVRKVCKHRLPLSILKFSPTMRFLASGDVEGNITIYKWESCEVFLLVRSKRKLNTIFDWHPWNGVDLAISEDMPASIAILNVPSKEIVAYYQRKDRKIIINSITFSKLTGELLVSISKHDADGCIDFKVLVMASLDRVVDMLYISDNGARFLMWNPDGSKLGTIGNDETLTIWHYSAVPSPSKCGAARTTASVSPQTAYGNVFRRWSCLR